MSLTLWWNIPSLCLVHFPLVPWWWYNKLTKHKVKKFKIFHCQKIQFPPRTKKSTINKHEFNTCYNNIHFSSHNKISCDSFFDCLTNLICFFHRKFYRENSENSQVIVQKHAAKFVHTSHAYVIECVHMRLAGESKMNCKKKITQFVIFNPWKVPWNWIAFSPDSCVISPAISFIMFWDFPIFLPNFPFTTSETIWQLINMVFTSCLTSCRTT